ncbi:hypothetical protein E4U45_007087, partial [Claviceps purpurea]
TYDTSSSTSFNQFINAQSQAWWPEGSDPGGANAGNPPNHVEPSGEGERRDHLPSFGTIIPPQSNIKNMT